MTSRKMFAALAFLLLLCMPACTLVAAPTLPAVAVEPIQDIQILIDQAFHQTFDAQTQVAQSVAQTLAAMLTNTPLFTVAFSNTPTPAFTLTPEAARVTVLVETNCRKEPGTVFEGLGVLTPGQEAQVVGRSASNDNWIIKLPSNTTMTCWLWGQYASVTGNWQALPIVTPPPTPTPQFTPTLAASFILEFEDVQWCPTAYYSYNLKLTNNGSIPWNSVSVQITDLDTLEEGTFASDVFAYSTGCNETPYNGILYPGQESFTYGNMTPMHPHHNVKAVVRLCTEDGMMGTCLDRTITFNP